MTDGRVADYLSLAAQMRAAADKAFDPRIAAEYLALATKWVRLAEAAQRSDATAEHPRPAESTDRAH